MPTSNGKTAIVTGGSRGLGREVAAGLAGRGWRVVADGRDAGVLARATAAYGGTAVPGDVTDPSHRARLVEVAAEGTGRLDLLVNNAGILGPSPLPRLADFPLDGLTAIYRTNVVAALGIVQLALPLLQAAGGAVLNITSDAAVEAYPGWGGYGSGKAALEQLSRVLAAEEPDVLVWWLDPGDMRTRMHQDAYPGEDVSDRPDPATVVPAVLRVIQDRPPSGRLVAAGLATGGQR